jgi:hypothetical protein
MTTETRARLDNYLRKFKRADYGVTYSRAQIMEMALNDWLDRNEKESPRRRG